MVYIPIWTIKDGAAGASIPPLKNVYIPIWTIKDQEHVSADEYAALLFTFQYGRLKTP